MYVILAYEDFGIGKIEAWSLAGQEVLRLELHVLPDPKDNWDEIFSSLFIDKSRGRMLCLSKNNLNH